MRTTLDIEDDVYLFARERAAQERVSIGRVVSELMRRGVMNGQSSVAATPDPAGERAGDPAGFTWLNGFPVITSPVSSPRVVTQALIDRIRDEEGI